MVNESIWNQTLQNLESKVGEQQYRKWLQGLHFINVRDQHLELGAPNVFVRDWIYENYLNLIRQELASHFQGQLEIAIRVPEEAPIHRRSGPREERSLNVEAPTPEPVQTATRAGLKPNYTFREFVVGSSNQFAHAACQAVSEMPGGKYNPLFLFGGVGLGKTHLLHAIGHKILEQYPHYRVIYISSETFVNELINAIRFEKMHEFREKYRTSCDVLLIDDIQFLSGKERTQEEFFHTFNTLYEGGKQIALSSDKFPKDIEGLEERLRSRFEWGLIADIQAPEMETRVAIIKQKAEATGIVIPDSVAHFLANLLKNNVRELEGALIRLGAYASLTTQPIDLPLAKEVLKNFQVEKSRFLSIDQVQDSVSRFYQINIQELKSSKKSKHLTYPRQVAMYLCRKVLRSSFPDIGSKFGGKDHSTVIHAVRKIENSLKGDAKLRSEILQLEKELNPEQN